MNLEPINWHQCVRLVHRDFHSSNQDYDKIIGVTRGGVILASLIHRFFPTAQLCLAGANTKLSVGDSNVLVVDDIWDTGGTIQELNKNAYVREGNLDFYTLVSKQRTTIHSHRFGVLLDTPKWIVFPWEIEEEEG